MSLLVIFIFGLIFFVFQTTLEFDDAYMFIRYAENMKTHGVFGWNFDQPSYGCTSVAYVFSNYLLIQAGLLEILRQEQFLMLHSLFYFIIGLAIIYKILSKVFLQHKASTIYTLVAILFLLTNPISVKNALNGMDTSMAFFSNALLIYSAFCYKEKPNFTKLFLFALCAYFTFFVRPDNGIYSVIFSLLFLLNQQKRRYIFQFIIILALLFGLDLFIKYSYFGDFKPIPFYVKSKSFYIAYLGIDNWNTWRFLTDFFIYLSPVVVISIVSLRRNLFTKVYPFIIPFILTCIFFLNTVPIMGMGARFLFPSIPFLIVSTAILFNESFDLWINLNKRFIKKNIIPAVLVFTLILIMVRMAGLQLYKVKKEAVILEAQKFQILFTDRVKDYPADWWGTINQMNKLVQKIYKSDFVIAASEHGFISSNNLKTPILCLAGLHNTFVLKEKSLNKAAIDSSLVQHKPDLIWMPHNDYVNLRYTILKSEHFKANYDFFYGLFDYGIAIRKNSRYYSDLIEHCKSEFKLESLHPTRYITN